MPKKQIIMSEQIKNRSLLVQPLQDISLSKVIPEIHRQATTKSQKKLLSYDPSPLLYMTIFGLWGLCLLWFQPRLWSLMVIPESVPAQAVLLFFILFIDLAWLYGLYNVCVVIFALIHRYTASKCAIMCRSGLSQLYSLYP